MNYISVDGRLMPAGEPVLPINNRSYRYGEGLFETMRVKSGKILFQNWHFERLFSGLERIELPLPLHITAEKLAREVVELCTINNCWNLARVRLSVSRGGGNINDADQFQYVLECNSMEEHLSPVKGILIDLYPFARKAYDRFSDLKSANYLPYVMAARYARVNELDDSLVLNANGRIAESSVANIFIVREGQLITPSLEEGCVAGIIRRWIVEHYKVVQTGLCQEDILSAEEVFLTNAIRGIQWVRQFRDKLYTGNIALAIFEKLKNEGG